MLWGVIVAERNPFLVSWWLWRDSSGSEVTGEGVYVSQDLTPAQQQECNVQCVWGGCSNLVCLGLASLQRFSAANTSPIVWIRPRSLSGKFTVNISSQFLRICSGGEITRVHRSAGQLTHPGLCVQVGSNGDALPFLLRRPLVSDGLQFLLHLLQGYWGWWGMGKGGIDWGLLAWGGGKHVCK